MNVDLAQVEAGLKVLAGADFSGALEAFQSGDILGEINTAEQALAVVAVFVPQAAYIKDALILLSLIVKGYETGAIKSASVEDPAMMHAQGSNH